MDVKVYGHLTSLAIRISTNLLPLHMQGILIALVFLGAAFYLGRMVFRSFQAKNECASGCAKCGAADLEKVKKTLG